MVADADVSMRGVSFTQLILNALHGHESVKAQSMTTDNNVREQDSLLAQEDLYTLPFNTVELVEQFFSLRHPLSPVFHVPSVRPVFDAALRCPSEQRHYHRSSFVLLNMIFAICTSHWLIGREDNPIAARRHYDIAMTLMRPNLLRDWSLQHVQALLIGARYLQGSNCAGECWNVLGLAIRIAYGLRLHRDPPDTDPYPLKESKRRVWYAAFTLDVLLSMIYDRPSAIRSAECSVRLPEDLDDRYIQDGGPVYPTPRQPSYVSFSIEVIKLYQILESVTSRLTSDMTNAQEIAALVIPLDEEYRKWHRSVPSHLVLHYNAPEEQPWILALRANMVRILIHRQSLLVTLHGLCNSQEVDDSMTSHALQYSRHICVNAAIETIEIVALRHEVTRKTMGLNWFNVYYRKCILLRSYTSASNVRPSAVFNAVIVLVSHVVNPAYSNDKAALAKVDEALHMIKAMSSYHAFALRAYSFLQQVLGYMNQSMAVHRDSNDSIRGRDLLPSQPTGALSSGLQSNAESVPNLHTLFGFTEDLTYNLEAYLESFDNGGFTDGPWPSGDPAIEGLTMACNP